MPRSGQGGRSDRSAIAAVGAVVFDDRGRVLLVRRARPPAAGEWTLPGGRIEAGESPECAVVRELMEETAIDARVISSLGVVTFEATDGAAYAIHEFLLVPRGEASPRGGDDAAEARWVERSEVERMGVRREAIDVILRGVELTLRLQAS